MLMFVMVFASISAYVVADIFTSGELNHWGLQCQNSGICLTVVCVSWYWFIAHARVYPVAAPPLLCVWGFLMLSSNHSINMVRNIALSAWLSHVIPLLLLYGGQMSPIPGLVPPNYMVNCNSLVGIKPGDSGVVIGYWVCNVTLKDNSIN